MLWLFSFISVLITALCTLFFAKIRVIVIYQEKNIIVKMGGKHALITVYNKKTEEDKPKDYIKIPTFENLKKKFSVAKRVFNEEKQEIILILKTLNSKVIVDSLNISVTFGFGDAAVTGIANGFIWTALTAFHGFLLRYLDIQKVTNIAVCPKYTNKCFDINVTFIFDANIFDIMDIWKKINILIKRNTFQFKD